jgi:hypothetical protein
MADTPIASPREATTDDARSVDDVAIDLVGLATLVAIGLGLTMLQAGNLAWDRGAVIAGVAGQLAETLPAAALVLVATGANLAAGGVLARAVIGGPIAGLGRVVLAATVGAVILDAALLFGLGGVGLFRAPVLLAIHAAILGVGWWRLRPFVARGSVSFERLSVPWAIVGVMWAGAFVLQLASPVVPFLDVLANHVAPIERLRSLGEFAVLTESPAPIYGPSRSFLGYIGWLGTVTTMTGLPAGLAASAFILPASLLVGVAVHRLATVLGGAGAGLWGLIAFALTASFGRLTDARATVLVLPVALAALAWTVERVDALDVDGDDDEAAADPPVRDSLLLGGALGAAVLVHPVVGALTVATVGLVVLIRPAFAPVGVPAAAVASCLALPQGAAMLGIGLPSIVGLVAVVPALVLARLLASESIGWLAVVLGRAVLFALVPIALAWSDSVVQGVIEGLRELLTTMPLLAIGAVAGWVLAPRRAGHPVVIAALVAGAAMAALTQAVPGGGGLLSDSIKFELPKTLHYWIPVFAALATGLGLVTLTRRTDLPLGMRAGLVGMFLVVAALPIRGGIEEIDDHHLGEHRFAETLAVDLRWAGRGYWATYPDARRVVDGPREELLGIVRDAIRDGRIDGSTNLLHIAPTFQQWSATPFAVFTGVRETVVSPDAAETIHTVGGRLRPPTELPSLLRDLSYTWAVLEPGDGVPAGTREEILAAGFEPLFANGQGEVFVREAGGG